MLYKIDEGNIWLIILFTTGAFGVFDAGVILLSDIFKVKFPTKKRKKKDSS